MLTKLRSSVSGAVWSRRQPLADVGAVLSLLDGPSGCDPAFCVVWFRFRMLRRYLALWPAEVGRIYRVLEMVGEGCLGMVLSIFFLPVLLKLVFFWDPGVLAWVQEGVQPQLYADNLKFHFYGSSCASACCSGHYWLCQVGWAGASSQ